MKEAQAETAHFATERETFDHDDDGTWSGIVRCQCGWSFDVTGKLSQVSVEVSLQGAWIHHSQVS